MNPTRALGILLLSSQLLAQDVKSIDQIQREDQLHRAMDALNDLDARLDVLVKHRASIRRPQAIEYKLTIIIPTGSHTQPALRLTSDRHAGIVGGLYRRSDIDG